MSPVRWPVRWPGYHHMEPAGRLINLLRLTILFSVLEACSNSTFSLSRPHKSRLLLRTTLYLRIYRCSMLMRRGVLRNL